VEDYDLALHTAVYHTIQKILLSKSLSAEYRKIHFLDSDNEQDIWTKISIQVERYIVEIRRVLPPPQLVKVCVWLRCLQGTVYGDHTNTRQPHTQPQAEGGSFSHGGSTFI
jgi:hypothetical protein